MRDLLLSEIEHLLDLTDEQNRFILDESPRELRELDTRLLFSRAEDSRKVALRLRNLLKDIKEEERNQS